MVSSEWMSTVGLMNGVNNKLWNDEKKDLRRGFIYERRLLNVSQNLSTPE